MVIGASKSRNMPKFFSLDTTIRGVFTLVINVGMYGKYAKVVSERIIQGEKRSTRREDRTVSCEKPQSHEDAKYLLR
jgi:hypothetical protein